MTLAKTEEPEDVAALDLVRRAPERSRELPVGRIEIRPHAKSEPARHKSYDICMASSFRAQSRLVDTTVQLNNVMVQTDARLLNRFARSWSGLQNGKPLRCGNAKRGRASSC